MMNIKTLTWTKVEIAATIAISLIFVALFTGTGYARNWDWDQNHDCVQAGGGSGGWGRYGYDGVFRGNESSKACCEIYCKLCPVYANTGRYQKSYTDLTVPGIGPTLEITRTYNSQHWSSGLLGYSWTFNFGRRLIIARNKDGEKIIGLLLRTGGKNYYRENLDGTLIRLTAYGATYDLFKNDDNTYTIYEKNGTTYELREDGRIDRIVDGNGNALVLSYSAVGCLSRITNASGNYVDITLGVNGKIANITDNLGRTVAYAYDDHGNLVSMTDPMGNTTQYGYNSNNYLVQITDPLGHVVESVGYDNHEPPRVSSMVEKGETYTIAYFDGRTEKTDSQGNRWIYYYNDNGVIERIVDPLGREKRHQFNQITATSLDWKEDAAGNRTAYTYDGDGNIAGKTDPLGNTWTYSYVSGTDLLASETNPLGVMTRHEYDEAGNQVALVRDSGGPTESRWTFTYDTQGNRTSVTDPNGNTTTHTFNSSGKLLEVRGPLGATIHFTYDERGNKISETNANGSLLRFTYNLNGRPLTITDPLGNLTSYTYDAAGNRTSMTNTMGQVTAFAYDTWGRMIQQTDPEGNTIRYSYDAQGNILSVTDSLDEITVYGYDAAGNRISVTDPLGRITTYLYDQNNRLIRETDAGGQTKHYIYDALGRLLNVTDTQGHSTGYAYDAAGNLVAVTDANGNTTQYLYDGQNRLIRQIRPMLQEENYSYDSMGNLIRKIDAKGQRTDYGYDASGHLIEVRFFADSSASVPIKNVQFYYDDQGNLLSYDDGTLSTSLTYDAMNRKLTETTNYGAFSLGNTYHYNAAGMPGAFTGPDGITYQYGYNNSKQLTAMDIPGVGSISVGNYQRRRPTTMSFPGGVNRATAYDALQRVQSITVQDPGGSALMNYNYTYDSVGHVITKNTEHGSYGYVYDRIYRLNQVDNPGFNDESFTYDPVGNRLTDNANAGTWTYNGNNELTGYDGVVYAYDANGNMIEKNDSGIINRYEYNIENRLVRVLDGGGAVLVRYYYDPFGRRVWKESNNVRTYFHYADQGLIGEYDAAGNELKTYGYKPEPFWGTDPLFMKVGAQYYWYHNDQIGTPQMMTTSSGAVVWRARYTGFGSAAVDDASSVSNNLRFPGQYYDQETGLHYNWHRYYDPNLGRYLRTDPIGLDGGINIYAYVDANPVGAVDALGLCWSNARAVAHYVNPFSGNVTLAQTGCVGRVSAATLSVRNGWRNSVSQQAEAAAKSFPCPAGGSATVTFNAAPGVHSGVFWIGGMTLHQNAICNVKKECKKCKWSFSCAISHRMNDLFEHPFDFDNSNSDLWDDVEVGRPFFVTHTWNDTVSGSGKL